MRHVEHPIDPDKSLDVNGAPARQRHDAVGSDDLLEARPMIRAPQHPFRDEDGSLDVLAGQKTCQPNPRKDLKQPVVPVLCKGTPSVNGLSEAPLRVLIAKYRLSRVIGHQPWEFEHFGALSTRQGPHCFVLGRSDAESGAVDPSRAKSTEDPSTIGLAPTDRGKVRPRW